MKNSFKYVSRICIALSICVLAIGNTAYASEDEEYITISVDAVDDNGETLQYALDTDDPAAFSSSNEFYVRAGTSHTIYVKDAAGNITSQDFDPGYSVSSTTSSVQIERDVDESNRTVNIDVYLDDEKETDYSDYEYAGDLLYDPAEQGQGEVYDKINTDAGDTDAERLFYTITTKEGEVFYLVVDQGRSSNNVYLLDQVNLSDLSALAVDDSREASSEESNSLLSAISNAGSGGNESASLETESSSKGKSNTSNLVFILLLAVIGGGVYYYMKVYKNKKNEQMDLADAMDKDDFIAGEEENDEDDVDFGLDDDYQDQIMQQLMEEDDEYFGAQDDGEVEEAVYATSHKDFEKEEAYAISHNNSLQEKTVVSVIEDDEDDDEEDDDDDL